MAIIYTSDPYPLLPIFFLLIKYFENDAKLNKFHSVVTGEYM